MQDKNAGNNAEADFSGNLRVAMRQKRWTQAQLGEASNIAQGTISNYLNGKRRPTADQLSRISHALGVNMEWLLYGEGEITPDADHESLPLRVITQREVKRSPSDAAIKIAKMETMINVASEEVDLLFLRLRDIETTLKKLRRILDVVIRK